MFSVTRKHEDEIFNKENCQTSNFYDIANNWLTKAGLCQISTELEVKEINTCNDNKNFIIDKLIIKQESNKIDNNFYFEKLNFEVLKNEKNYFYDSKNNLQTHLVDVLFIYYLNFDNLEISSSEITDKTDFNPIFRNVEISPKEKMELTQFSNKHLPKIIVLNYQDYGYFKWILDKKTLGYIKEITKNLDIISIIKTKNQSNKIHLNIEKELRDFYAYSDKLTKLNIYKSLYDMVFSNLIEIDTFMEIVSKLIIFEEKENIVNIVLKRLIKMAIYSSYRQPNFNIEKDFWIEYAFDLILYMLKYHYKIYSHLIKSNDIDNSINKREQENLIKIIFSRLLKITKKEKHFKILFDLLTQGPNKEVYLKDKIFYPDLYLETLLKIFESKDVDQKVKLSLLEKEKNNLDLKEKIEELESICFIKLPEFEIKKNCYSNIIINNKENLSLHALNNYIKNFYCLNQNEILYDYMNTEFFNNYEKIISKNDIYLTTYFINKLTKFDYSDRNLINKLIDLASEIKNKNDIGFKVLMSRLDKVNKIQKMIFNQNFAQTKSIR